MWTTSICLRFDIYGCNQLLKVPRPDISNIQGVNLQAAEGSFVDLTCNASTRSDVMTEGIRWGNKGKDITSLSSGVSTQGKISLSRLRVNYTTAKDILLISDCSRQNEPSRTVKCDNTFICVAFYSSLAFRLEPAYETAVVTVELRVPAAVNKITVDTILGTSAIVRWQQLSVGVDEDHITVYELWLSKESNPNNAKYFNASSNDTQVLKDLTRNTRYEVKVRAISAIGKGLWSSTAYFKTSRSVSCEEKILGAETGFYPDMTASSSQYNASTSASHSFMSYAVDIPWCADRNDNSPYLEVDLIDVHVICALSTRGDPQGKHWIETYTLQSSLDGTTWTDYKEVDQKRMFLGNYDSTSTVKEELYSGLASRKIRLHVKTFYGLACLKLQLFGVKQALDNLALNQPAIQSSTDAGGVPSRAVDGDTSTSLCTQTAAENDPWWRVDLGTFYPVKEVVIVSRVAVNGFEIRIGNVTSRGGTSNEICSSNLEISAGGAKTYHCGSTKFGRYVYVRIPGSSKSLSFCEIQVYSTISNLALYQPASQISILANGDASRAVDGKTSTDYFQENGCTHTNYATDPWWRVDLGTSLPVAEVVIVNRECGSCGDYLSGFEIRIGDEDVANIISNAKCGDLHSLASGETKTIYCLPRLVGQYVYIRIPRNRKFISVCEVEVYSRGRVGSVCAGQPVGTSDIFIIPDHRFSASSSRIANEPSKARLDGDSAWVPSTNNNNDDYLLIDLGSVYFVCGVATQGNSGSSEWTTQYKIKTSLNNRNWTVYMEHGTEKIFDGNINDNALRRNGLITSPLAKFIRFYPVSYSGAKALRVEVYGHAQGSKTPFGLENRDIIDAQLEASSNSASAVNGRLYNVSSWCSSITSSLEYFQVDLGNVKTIVGVATQGDPSSDRWVKTYTVSYSCEGNRWTQYEGYSHHPEILNGNNDRNSVQANWMVRPFVARYVRIYPNTWNSGICLRVDGYGSPLVNTPIISPGLVDKTLQKIRGSSGVLTCVAYGVPHVTVTWMTNGAELANSSDIASASTSTYNWEKIESNLTVTYRDAAYVKRLFRCTTVSQKSRILQCKTLSVTCNARYFGTLLEFSSTAVVSLGENLYLPDSPTQIVTSNIMSTSVTLAWNETDAGDSPILFYRVFYNTSLNLIPLSMNKTTAIRRVNISMLQPYTDYTFKVQAVSAIGGSRVSEGTSLITYLPASVFVPPPEVYRLSLGQKNVSFLCFGHGYPIPGIVWKKDGNPIVYPIVSQNLSAINSSKRLEVKADGVTYEEAGKYTCEVHNGVDGMTAASATLEVIFIPEFTLKPRDTTVVEGKSVVFNCNATGIPTPKISWSYSGAGGLPPNSRQLSNGSLLVTDVKNTVDYEGTYSCNVSSRAGASIAHANLTVWKLSRAFISPTKEMNLFKYDENVTVDCYGYGKPAPKITWIRHKKEIPTVYNFTDKDRKKVVQEIFQSSKESPWNVTSRLYLRLDGVTYQDAGNYTCEVFNGVGGNISASDTLQVFFPPQFTITLNKSVVAERGDTVRLSCSASGDPSPRYHWTKDGSQIISNATFENSNRTLQLTNVDSRNDGVYTCLAVNDAGRISTSSNVTIHGRPSLLESFPKITTKIEYHRVQLSCTGESIPPPTVMWFKNGEFISSNKHIVITTRGTFERVSTLTIEKVKYEDRGEFTCSFRNYRGNVNSTGRLIVYVPPDILIPPASVKEELGYQARFNCSIRGFPLPSLVWMKANANLNGSTGVQIQEHRDKDMIEGVTSLTIFQAKRGDTGEYICEANNSVGTTSRSANLTVLEKPDRLEAKIGSITSSTVHLLWTVLFDGNSPVLYFTVAHNTSNGTRSYNVSSSKWSYTVLYLIPATFYEFSITATNQLGTSHPVMVSNTTLEAEKPDRLEAKIGSISSRTVDLLWTVLFDGNSPVLYFTVAHNTSNGTRSYNVSSSKWSYTVLYLIPATFYEFSITATNQLGTSYPAMVSNTTLEAVPSRGPENVSTTEVNYTTFQIAWIALPKEASNGNIKMYQIKVILNKTCTVAQSPTYLTLNTTTREVLLSSLSICTRYDVAVRAYTMAGPGPYSKSIAFQTLGLPWSKEAPASPSFSTNSSGGGLIANIQLPRFPENAKFFQVIVISVRPEYNGVINSPQSFTPQDMLTYEEAHRSPIPAAYVSFEFAGNDFAKYQKFRLGSRTSKKRSSDVKEFENKPLQPNTNYRVFLRAFVTEEVYISSNFVEINTKDKPVVRQLPETIIFGVGKLAILTCEVSGDPEPSVIWAKDGDTNIPRAQFQNNGRILVIQDVIPGDRGVYECKAWNMFGESRTATTIIVAVPPSIEEDASPSSVICKKHTLCLLSCYATSDYPVTYAWTKNGGIPDIDGVKVNGSTLAIRPRDTKDYGVYMCNAMNSFGSTGYNIMLSECPECSAAVNRIQGENNQQHILRVVVIALSCVVVLQLFVIVFVLWRQRRAMSDKTDKPNKSTTAADRHDSARDHHVSEPGVYMELHPRPLEGESRAPLEYQTLHGENTEPGYYNVGVKRGDKVQNEEVYEEIGNEQA